MTVLTTYNQTEFQNIIFDTVKNAVQSEIAKTNTTITNNGDGNLINTGNYATISFSVSINKGNLEALKKTLQENHVSKEDVNDLLTVIDTESPVSNMHFEPKVNQWLYKMIGRAMDSSWKISIGTASGILAKAICHYYGIG